MNYSAKYTAEQFELGRSILKDYVSEIQHTVFP